MASLNESETALLGGCSRLIERTECPDLLWHYTSVEAAIKIIKKGSLWLSCHSSMNDPAEGQHAHKLVLACWNDALDRLVEHDGSVTDFLRQVALAPGLSAESKGHEPIKFIFSTSKLRDSLSQWTRYGSDGTGLALGFRISPRELPRGLCLTEVIYDLTGIEKAKEQTEGQETPYSSFRKELTNLLEGYARGISDTLQPRSWGLPVAAHILRLAIKQGAYHEEKEWRIVVQKTLHDTENYDFRSSRHGITPYVELPLGPAVKLEALMLGPKLSNENEWAAQWLCKKRGIEAEITRSAFAYR